MDELLTEEQQAERARRWLRENGLFVVAGVLLGLGGLFGWQQWNDRQLQQSGQASIVWEQIRQAIDSERYNEATEKLDLLAEDYPRTPYLSQARLAMARAHMDRNDPVLAMQELSLAAKLTQDPTVRRVAELRLAQLHIAEQQYDEALQLLSAPDNTQFAALRHDLRGDAYFYQGNFEAAADEYAQALASDSGGVIDRAYVQVKRDDMRGRITAAGAMEAASSLNDNAQ